MLSVIFLHVATLLAVNEALVDKSVEEIQELLVDWKLVSHHMFRNMGLHNRTTFKYAHRIMHLRKYLQTKNMTEMFYL